ncbi:hypothetical protein F503_07973 [Ophiostoma piceae UAMH 11346]|uniref:Uncharacterized protein n=1 Tax=Ophiostoma piceae (strain UAMH 11346) TaxID=1262450 RepID=S3C3G9_OPHP1|nr:hypothetical protein F503_07973 [Ophiostoma piceae UAMH 11346]
MQMPFSPMPPCARPCPSSPSPMLLCSFLDRPPDSPRSPLCKAHSDGAIEKQEALASPAHALLSPDLRSSNVLQRNWLWEDCDMQPLRTSLCRRYRGCLAPRGCTASDLRLDDYADASKSVSISPSLTRMARMKWQDDGNGKKERP